LLQRQKQLAKNQQIAQEKRNAPTTSPSFGTEETKLTNSEAYFRTSGYFLFISKFQLELVYNLVISGLILDTIGNYLLIFEGQADSLAVCTLIHYQPI
jgi:hypothetical protein